MLTFGYVSFRVWGEDKPTFILNRIWWYASPLLFATVGALLVFSKISAALVTKSLAIILVALFAKMITAFLVTGGKGWTYKERAFIGVI